MLNLANGFDFLNDCLLSLYWSVLFCKVFLSFRNVPSNKKHYWYCYWIITVFWQSSKHFNASVLFRGKNKSKRLQFSLYIIAHIVELFLSLSMNPHKPYYALTKILQVNPGENWKKSCIFCVVPIMSTTRDFLLWFNSTIAFAIGVLGISRAFLVKLLRLCTIYHSLTCVMFQILVQRGYSWRQLFLCWAVIKDNISYLSKQKERKIHCRNRN